MCIWHPETWLLTTAEWEAAGVGLQEQRSTCWGDRKGERWNEMLRIDLCTVLKGYGFVGELGGCWFLPTVPLNRMPLYYCIYCIIVSWRNLGWGIHIVNYISRTWLWGLILGWVGDIQEDSKGCSNDWWESLPTRKYSTFLLCHQIWGDEHLIN